MSYKVSNNFNAVSLPPKMLAYFVFIILYLLFYYKLLLHTLHTA